MREVPQGDVESTLGGTFAACLATILELDLGDVPVPDQDDELPGWRTTRWLGGLGLGLTPVAGPEGFTWAGPWIGLARPDGGGEPRAVVMFGVPSGVVWDPSEVTGNGHRLTAGFVVAALDIALARPPLPEAPGRAGTVAQIFVAQEAGAPVRALSDARALPGKGLEGDRHTTGKGTFPSDLPGSAVTLIEAEVCEAFDPPLDAGEHRRNIVTRGIDLNALVGREFAVGAVRCRGMRLCEPCTVVEGYAARPVLRALVHRGGLRADILEPGVISVGDRVRPLG